MKFISKMVFHMTNINSLISHFGNSTQRQLLITVQRPLSISCVKNLSSSSSSSLVLYNPLHALASLMISLPRSLAHALFHHVFTSKVLRYFNTESSHLNLGLSFFLLPSGWEKVIFMKGTLPSILTMCPNHFNVAILIIFTMLGCLYKLYNSSLCFILHTSLTQIWP